MKIICESCGYTFKAEKIPKICPYCGEMNTLIIEKKADDFLNEVHE